MSGWTEPRATESDTLSIRGLLLLPIATLAHATRLFPTNGCFSIALLPLATLIVVKHSTGFWVFRAIFPADAITVHDSPGLPVFPCANLCPSTCCVVSHIPAVGVAVGNTPASSRFCSTGKGYRQSGQWLPAVGLPPLAAWVRNRQWLRAPTAVVWHGRHSPTNRSGGCA